MSKRYQVFVSSTFEDLQEERQHVTYALLMMDCIPAGMELFPASNDDQWTLIQRVIDECDYYLLILAGRYGSLDRDDTGYTEKEFDYAIKTGKPVIAFLHKDPASIPIGKSETDPEQKKRLEAFRKKAQQRMVQFWSSSDDLAAKVEASLFSLFKTHPSVGWEKGNRNHYADHLFGLDIEENIIRAFREGGSAKRLEGTWRATWSSVDMTGSPQPSLVCDPSNPNAKITYPAEQIVLKSEGAVVFCTSEDLGRRYWLGGRMSLKNELCLIYWTESHPMGGTVFLTLIEKHPGPRKLTGWWCGHNREDEVVFGHVEWIKVELEEPIQR